MAHLHHRLDVDTFERLREQLATAAALCGEDQLLTLADGLHDAIRRRRTMRNCGGLGWDPCPPGVMNELASFRD